MLCASRRAFLFKRIKKLQVPLAVRTVASISDDKHVVKSNFKPIDFPLINLDQFVWKDFHKWHDKVAIECAVTGKTYTYSELYKKSRSVACFLRRSVGLNYGDVMAIILPNLPEYGVILLAAYHAGLPLTTINPLFTSDEISKQLKDCNSKLVFTSEESWKAVKGALNDLPGVKLAFVGQTNGQSLPRSVISFNQMIENEYKGPLETVGLDDLALIPYSSGTTGLPKGVQLTHRSLVNNLFQSTIPEIRLYEDTTAQYQDVIPAIMPFFHVYGSVLIFMTLIANGCKLVTSPTFGSEIMLKLLKQHKPSIVYTSPPIFLMLLNNPKFKSNFFESVRILMCGAAPLAKTDIERFTEKTKGKIPVIQAYGMTEASPITHFQSTSLPNGIKFGGCGFVVPNTECKAVAVDDENYTALPANQSGHLLVRGPQIMKGYLNNPKSTAETITSDGWLKTGDIGHYDEDKHFFITDRFKELIKVKAYQVAPAELEALLRHHPLIADSAVIGIPHEKYGEVPKAYVVPKSNSKISGQQIQEYVATKVISYKHLLGGVEFIEAIPRTPSGKILRKDLKLLNC